MSEIRFALRRLTTNPGPTLVVVVTLAVAIGATTVVYSTIDAIWHFLPIADRSGLVFVASVDPRQGEAMRLGVSVPDLADLSGQSTTVAEFAGLQQGSASLTGVDVPDRVSTIRATTNLLTMWRVTLAAGRVFRPDDGRPGAEGVTLLTHQFWQRQFSSSPAAVGRSVLLDHEPHTIVGVLAPDASVGIFRQTDMIVPLPVDALRGDRNDREALVTARLRPGVSLDEAAVDLETIARRLQAQHPQTNGQVRVQVLPLIEATGFNVRFLLFLLGVVGLLVVAIACASVTNIVLAEATARRHERAVRTALGASRFAHIRQMMIESMAVAFAACAAGLVLAWWGIAGLAWLAGPEAYGFSELALNARVLVAGVVTSLLAPLAFGLLPAVRSSTVEAGELKEGGRSGATATSGRRLRNVVVAVQVGLAMILMVQITLTLRAGWTLSTLDSGFDRRQLLTFRVDLPAAKYGQPEARGQFFRSLLARLQELPGVTAAGTIDRMPIVDSESRMPLVVDGAPTVPAESRPLAARSAIGGDYLQAMRIALVSGRAFTAAEESDAAPVALVSKETARRFWPAGVPPGARVTFDSPPGPEEWLAVVGVVENVRDSEANIAPLLEVYVPASRRPVPAMAFVVRSQGPDPLQLVPAVRAAVAVLDPNQPIHDVASMEQVIHDDLLGTYVLTALLAAVALVALCLAAAGIYGVVSYSVTQRTREIGVRIALGARPRVVQRMIISQGAVPVAAGGLVGLLGAIALAYLTAGGMPGIDVRDPINYAGVVTSIALVALAASYLPARRASRVDPAMTLRAE